MSKQEQFELLQRVTRGLAGAIGSHCEVVLHDLSRPEHSIIVIENGHVTGRQVGDALDDFGLEIVRSETEEMINYRATTKDGKELRSSFMCFRDDEGKLFAMICINYDLTKFIHAAEALGDVISQLKVGVQESFQKDIDTVLDELIKNAIANCGKEVGQMNREDKIAIVAALDRRGAFLIRYSVDRVATLLNISKYSIYNYLDAIKNRQLQVIEKSAQ